MGTDDRRPDSRLMLTRLQRDLFNPSGKDSACDPPPRIACTYVECVDVILNARARFADRFDTSLFSDPALDMVLALFSATEDGRTMTINNCCAASRVPRTTALRWIKLLTARNHVIATEDLSDRRSTLLRLAPAACEDIRQWLDECITMGPGNGSSKIVDPS